MLLAVRISSYGCTWEVWRALKKLELHSELLRIFSALQTSRVHPQLDIRTLSMNKFLNFPFLLKVIETCALSLMNSYLLQNDLFPTNDNSTETALLCITNYILQAIDKHEDTILVLLDLSAAFDTIDHQVSLNRLH